MDAAVSAYPTMLAPGHRLQLLYRPMNSRTIFLMPGSTWYAVLLLAFRAHMSHTFTARAFTFNFETSGTRSKSCRWIFVYSSATVRGVAGFGSFFLFLLLLAAAAAAAPSTPGPAAFAFAAATPAAPRKVPFAFRAAAPTPAEDEEAAPLALAAVLTPGGKSGMFAGSSQLRSPCGSEDGGAPAAFGAAAAGSLLALFALRRRGGIFRLALASDAWDPIGKSVLRLVKSMVRVSSGIVAIF
mmetsp:Transcript_20961/g.52948  ORF Transcript_20961/g.52948 Transcript_20961/m.52948 type:complete len:241 (+) Transcript_20961:1071-1793(+)